MFIREERSADIAAIRQEEEEEEAFVQAARAGNAG